MVTALLKQMATRLPSRYQQDLKRLHFRRMIRNGTFETAEDNDREYGRLQEWVKPGDWVIDAGANVGNYAARLSDLVGASGRVFAFEPIPETFELLTANIGQLANRNVTLFNVAVSDEAGLKGMSVPVMQNGMRNPYMAHLGGEDVAGLAVMCLPIDRLQIPRRVSLVKIDVEGHELPALRGMRALLDRDHPLLVVEGRSEEVASYLGSLGYTFEDAASSPNRVFKRG